MKELIPIYVLLSAITVLLLYRAPDCDKKFQADREEFYKNFLKDSIKPLPLQEYYYKTNKDTAQ